MQNVSEGYHYVLFIIYYFHNLYLNLTRHYRYIAIYSDIIILHCFEGKFKYVNQALDLISVKIMSPNYST